MTTDFLILTRAVHFASCLLFFGIFAFDRLIAALIYKNGGTEICHWWLARLRFFRRLLLPLIFLSGVFWFVLTAMMMSGDPLRQTIQPHLLNIVWSQTEFGDLWKWRLIFWLVAVGIGLLAASRYFQSRKSFREIFIWLQFVFGALLLGSLSWTGHGLEGSRWHLAADILHLLVAGIWPTGLLSLLLLLRKLRRVSPLERVHVSASLVRYFSAWSFVSVVLLAFTGWVNAWFLVGSFANLWDQPYGRWLLAKIALFCIAVAIGAVNLLLLKPRLSTLPANGEPHTISALEITSAKLRLNVEIELVLGTVIVIIVAILGVLPPALH